MEATWNEVEKSAYYERHVAGGGGITNSFGRDSGREKLTFAAAPNGSPSILPLRSMPGVWLARDSVVKTIDQVFLKRARWTMDSGIRCFPFPWKRKYGKFLRPFVPFKVKSTELSGSSVSDKEKAGILCQASQC